MSGFKDLAKGGWHPKGKNGGKESWRGDFKGINTVAGWMGKGKDPNQEAREHISAPLSTLKDPSQFAPPPRRTDHGASVGSTTTAPVRTGLGAPLSQNQIQSQQRQAEAEAEAELRAQQEEERPPSPKPYRVDTTGLSTTGLPPPPKFNGMTPPPPPPTRATTGRAAIEAPKAAPRLPPRLPPRQNSNPNEFTPPPPPSYRNATQSPVEQPTGGLFPQSSISRLSAAGVSVPGFDIGRNNTTSPPVSARNNLPSPTAQPTSPPLGHSSQLGELQSRFSRLRTTSQDTAQPTAQASAPAAQGTTFAQKQAAVKTFNSFRNDPSSVSLSDARSAASTANNFRERHGEQAASGMRTANGLNQKYNVAGRLGSFGGAGGTTTAPDAPTPASEYVTPLSSPPIASPTGMGAGLGGVVKKKPPPPPPAKKKELSGLPVESNPWADGGGGAGDEPPPVPFSSRPRF